MISNKIIKKRFAHLIPFLIICISLIYTSFSKKGLIHLDLKQQIALGSASLNLLLYLFRFKYGILATGILLLMATFDLLRIFSVVTIFNNSIQIGDVNLQAPVIELESLLLTVLYFILNKIYLINLYHEYKKSGHT